VRLLYERCMTSSLGSRFKAGQSVAAVGKLYDVITWIKGFKAGQNACGSCREGV
jgi:hypothetical protein